MLKTMVSEVQENWELIDDEKAARLAELFSITQEEIAVVGRDRLKDLVLERVALLEVNR
jgi:KEOPS complex subunit Cgi121